MAPGLSGAAAGDAFPTREALAHPAFDVLRPALDRLAADVWPDAAQLNALAAAIGAPPRNALGLPIRFVAPPAGLRGYEQHVHATGEVPTRPRNLHDLFNALAWLAFPTLKATLNALHVREIPHEQGRRGPFRDLLTLLDEGGALVACADAALARCVWEHRWIELFWERRTSLAHDLRIVVVGHAVLEKALAPWPGVSCKAVFLDTGRAALAAPLPELAAQLDARAALWLAALPREARPRDLPPLPIFGFPGWHPANDDAAFYADARHFRPLSTVRTQTAAA